jgi:hypothetical protein
MQTSIQSEIGPEQFDCGVTAVRETPKKWFAAYTSSHHEKRVAAQLALRQIEFFYLCIRRSTAGTIAAP